MEATSACARTTKVRDFKGDRRDPRKIPDRYNNKPLLMATSRLTEISLKQKHLLSDLLAKTNWRKTPRCTAKQRYTRSWRIR
ncbi:hypothetical protein [Scytonema sp. NUACC21]